MSGLLTTEAAAESDEGAAAKEQERTRLGHRTGVAFRENRRAGCIVLVRTLRREHEDLVGAIGAKELKVKSDGGRAIR
jgi:hypothetical protein